MTRIDLVTPPFSGHLHPILALGRALAGEHDVRVLSTAAALPRIAAAGLQGQGLLDGVEAELTRIVDPPYAVGHHPLRLHRQFHAALGILVRLSQELQARYAQERPDLLIADFTLPVAGHAAARFGIPWWTSLPSPCVLETRDGPVAYRGGRMPAQTTWQRLRERLDRALVRGFKRSVFALYRRSIARTGITRLYRDDGSEAVYSPHCVLAIGMAELEFARSWPAPVRFLGPMPYTPPSPHQPPPFRAGQRHVLVTLGTHLRFHKDTFAAQARELARARPDLDVHFSDGDVHRNERTCAQNFVRASFIDYAAHLPRYDLVVHHGGTGAMYYALAAGKPAVVYPLDYDQFDHAARLSAAGIALWLKRPGDLATAVGHALDDAAMAARCRQWQAKLAAHDGAGLLRHLVRDALAAPRGPTSS